MRGPPPLDALVYTERKVRRRCSRESLRERENSREGGICDKAAKREREKERRVRRE